MLLIGIAQNSVRERKTRIFPRRFQL